MRKSSIYMITCNKTGKRYIGQTVKKLSYRLNDHRSYAEKHPEATFKLPNAIRKHGIESFFIELIEICSVDEVNDREIYWIKFMDTYNTGYNSTLGGHQRDDSSILRGEEHPLYGVTGENHPAFGYHHTDVAKKVIGDSVRGRPVSEETRKKRSEAILGEKNQWYGKSQPKEMVEKRAASMKEGYASGRIAKPSFEQGRRLGQSNIGRKASAETRAKQSASLKGKPKSEAHIQALRAARARKKAENERLEKERAQNDHRHEERPRDEKG